LSDEPKNCPNCLQAADEGKEFCPNCGAFLGSPHDFPQDSGTETRKKLDGCSIGCLVVVALLTAFMAGCGLLSAFQPPDEYGFREMAMFIGAGGFIGFTAIMIYFAWQRKKKRNR
jgi:hypothetical protein